MKEMGDKNNKSNDDKEKNDDTDEKKNHTKIELVRISLGHSFQILQEIVESQVSKNIYYKCLII